MNHEDTNGKREIFKYMSLAYDVTAAKALVEGLKAEAEINPAQWRDWISREIRCGNSSRMATLGIRVYADHVPVVDLEDPVIVAQFTLPGEDPIPIPIDGWHRIQKAINENRARLPAYFLSLEDSNKVRIR